MNDDRAFERATRDWLEAGSDRTPAESIDAVLLAVRTTPQERDLRIPWRTPTMSNPMRLAASIAIIAVVAFAGLNLIGRGGTGGTPTPSPTVTATQSPAASATAAPSPAASVDMAAWVQFTSARDGYSIRYPAAWTVTAATAPWTYPPAADYPPGAIDEFRPASPDPGSFTVTSQAIPLGVSNDAWFTAYIQDPFHNGCFPARAQWESITIAGQPAGVHGNMVQCNFTEAVAIVGGRAYVFTVTPNKTAISGVIYPRNLFDALLSTVVFEPQKANDAPIASQAPSPGPS